ncbi:hypothetical protein K2X33_00240 [bacterium]|nr:hypothetical protein [bacterium]
MLENVTRPSFFPGQLLDFRDFNRLAEQPERAAQISNQALFPSGGILLRSGEEFALRFQGLHVIVRPGSAVLPDGSHIVLQKEAVLDLAPYKLQQAGTLFVTLEAETAARDLFTDPEDPSIQGFRTVAKEAKLCARFGQPAAGGLEIFRTVLSADTQNLRLPSGAEEWMASDLPPSGASATVDTRFRKKIVPLSLSVLEFDHLVALRTALYQMEDAHRRLQKIFLLKDEYDCSFRLTHLHTELLNVPFQPLKTAFVLSDFAEKLSLFLEAIYRRCSVDQPNFDRDSYLRLCTLLDSMRSRRAVPEALPLERLLELSQALHAFAVFGEQRFSLLNAVEQALEELGDRAVDFAAQTTLAGHVFERVDRLSAMDKDRVSYGESAHQLRKMQTRYRNGDAMERTGAFLREGRVQLDFQIANPEAPVVVWLPQYLRRRGAKVEYRINGKSLLSEKEVAQGAENIWKNRGLVIAPEALVPQGNRLTIRIEEADLEFGFFELAVYQPLKLAGAA